LLVAEFPLDGDIEALREQEPHILPADLEGPPLCGPGRTSPAEDDRDAEDA